MRGFSIRQFLNTCLSTICMLTLNYLALQPDNSLYSVVCFGYVLIMLKNRL